EWVGPHDDETLGLNDAARYYCGPGWAGPGAALCPDIHLDGWASPTPALQRGFRGAGKAANWPLSSAYLVKDPAACRRLVAPRTQPRVFSNETMQVFTDSWPRIDADLRSGNATYARIAESVDAYLAGVRPFDQRNEHAYEAFVYS